MKIIINSDFREDTFIAILPCEECNQEQLFTLKAKEGKDSLEGECRMGHVVEICVKDPSKRRFLKVAVTTAIATLVGGTSVLNLMFPDIRKWFIGEFIKGPKRLKQNTTDFIEKLGIDFGRIYIDIGKKDTRIENYPYDHAVAGEALRTSINNLYDKARIEVLDLNRNDTLWIRTDSHFVLFGGPNSNPLTAIACGFEGYGNNLEPQDDYYSNIIPLRFYGISDVNDERVQKRVNISIRGFGNKLIDKVNWGFIDIVTSKLYNCEKFNLNDEPLNDPLLITKMPNIFSPNFEKENLSLLIIDGAHNIGTGAFEVLLDEIQVLEEINYELKGMEAFQILLDATDVKPQKKGKDVFHKATSIEMKLPPHRLPNFSDERYLKAHQYAQKRLKELDIDRLGTVQRHR